MGRKKDNVERTTVSVRVPTLLLNEARLAGVNLTQASEKGIRLYCGFYPLTKASGMICELLSEFDEAVGKGGGDTQKFALIRKAISSLREGVGTEKKLLDALMEKPEKVSEQADNFLQGKPEVIKGKCDACGKDAEIRKFEYDDSYWCQSCWEGKDSATGKEM